MSDETSSSLPPKPSAPDVVAAAVSQSFSGPLPPPDLLSGYELACPGAADRIIRMAEEEAAHRRIMEAAVVNAGAAESERESNDAKRGQIFALLIVMASIGGCIYLAMNGHELAASALGVGVRLDRS